MLGILYIVLCFFTGRALALPMFEKNKEAWKRWEGFHKIWIWLPLCFTVGTIVLTWLTYLLGLLFQNGETPLFAANIIAMVAGCLLTGISFRYGNISRVLRKENSKRMGKEVLFFLLMGAVTLALMFHVFFIKDGVMYEGYTVFSDFSPHLSLIRSFSKGNNFPTQYPYFGGSDIRYHFLYQFLIGNLEYLGMRVDLAFNLISTLCVVGVLMLLYGLAWRLFRRYAAGVMAGIAFFTFSGPTCISFFANHIKAGDLLQTLLAHEEFIGYVTQETWGLWCFNVFLNQRHLALGICVLLLVLLFYVSYLEQSFVSADSKGVRFFIQGIIKREHWKCIHGKEALLVGILIGLLAFWNGAVTITVLLILFGFAVVSQGKFDYLITAGTALALSFLQSHLFMEESAVSPAFCWGFIAENPTFLGVWEYIFRTWGIFLLLLLAGMWFFSGVQRYFAAAVCIPFVFSFCVSLTPDVTVNHKYIMMTVMLLTIYGAELLIRLWKQKRQVWKILVVVLTAVLLFTGVYDLFVIVHNNDKNHRVSQEVSDETTVWLEEHTNSQDLILTEDYYINQITISGCMMYYGWPYYAWSAGYDTDAREGLWQQMYLAEDSATLRSLIWKNKISYIIVEDNQSIEDLPVREDVIAATYPKVYTSKDGYYRIYQTED